MMRPTAILATALLFVLAAPRADAQYLIEQNLSGGYNPWIKGQSFTPNVGIVPDPGPVATLDLTKITFYRSGQAWTGPTSHFFLNLYDGDPVNGAGQFVGSSSHAVDVSLLGNAAPIEWSFDYLTLDPGQQYWALVSSTDTAGGLDVWCGMRESGATDPYAGGVNIAGIAGDEGGFHVKPAIDTAFEIELSDSLSLIGDATTLTEGPSTVHFELDLGPDQAGSLYLLGIGFSGSMPGTSLPGGLTLPVNWDLLTDLAIQFNNVAWFYDFWGTLDASGRASPRLEWPGVPGTAGMVFDLAACTAQPFDEVTNGWSLEVLPEPVTPEIELFVVYKGSSDTRRLGRVDYTDPEAIQHIGNLGLKFIRGLSFDGSGTLYAYESQLWGPGQLYEVDQTTAALTPIGPSTSQRIDGMAYNPVDGTMYGVEAATSALLSIDLATGALTHQGTIQDDGPLPWSGMYALATDDEGYFYTYNNASDALFSGVHEQGIWRSTQPGGLQFSLHLDLWAEFGITDPAGLDVPVPLFVDWSSGDDTVLGLVPEGNYPFDGFFAFHGNAQVTGWTAYPPPPSGDLSIQAWSAAPQTGN